MKRLLKHKISKFVVAALFLIAAATTFTYMSPAHSAYADNSSQFTLNPDTTPTGYGCGSNDQNGGQQGLIHTSIDFGCQGNPCAAGQTGGYCSTYHNGIIDMLFAIIRLLGAGVGIVVIASVIVGGIQFATSRSDPQASASAIGRIRSSLIALIIYIFAYAILNFVIPGGFFTRS